MKRLLLIAGFLALVAGSILAYGIHRHGYSSFVLLDRPHECPTLQSPVDVRQVTSVLYPGQTRGGDYKPHGGFRFDGLPNDAVLVRAPIDATLVSAGGNTMPGVAQYKLQFTTDCGLELMFDHLLTLTPKFQAVLAKLPALTPDRNQTYPVKPPVTVQVGELIATAVGFTWPDGSPNTSFDFGVFERWIANDSARDAAWRAKHRGVGSYNAAHGLCWLELLPAADGTTLKTLRGGDSESGTTSDYCN